MQLPHLKIALVQWDLSFQSFDWSCLS